MKYIRLILFCVIFLCCTSIVVADNLSDSNKLFDWIEAKYSKYFSPAGSETLEYQGYFYRYYPYTDTFLVTSDDSFFVGGDIFGGFIYVGKLSTFINYIQASSQKADNSIKSAIVGHNWHGESKIHWGTQYEVSYLKFYSNGEWEMKSGHTWAFYKCTGTYQINGNSITGKTNGKTCYDTYYGPYGFHYNGGFKLSFINSKKLHVEYISTGGSDFDLSY